MSNGLEDSLIASLLGAFEGALSIVLTFAAGYAAARLALVDHHSIKHVSTLCSGLFLPCLIVVQLGAQLTAGELRRMWVLPAWGLASSALAHALDWLGHVLLGTPWWVVAAAGRPNSSAMPLLLVEALAHTGMLAVLSDEPPARVVERAQSLILLNVVVQETLTLQLAPALLRRDGARAGRMRDEEMRDEEERGPERLACERPVDSIAKINPALEDRSRVGLLQDTDHRHRERQLNSPAYEEAFTPLLDKPNLSASKRLGAARALLRRVAGAPSPPLLAATAALALGMVPALHSAFYSPDSALDVTVTQTLRNLGRLFVVLQMFVVGADLALVPNAHPGTVNATFALALRFVVMPGLSLLLVWLSAGRGWYVNDRLVWFLLIIIPAGPSASLLASVAETVEVDQGAVSSFLGISYLFSPLIAVVCSAALLVVQDAWKRTS